MFDFHEKRKIRGLVYSKFSIAFILGLTVLLSFSVYERFSVDREMSAKRVERQTALVALQAREAKLEDQVAKLKDNRGIEGELRSRFDVAKKGEQTVIIVGKDDNAKANLEQLSVPPGTATATPPVHHWWNVFKFW